MKRTVTVQSPRINCTQINLLMLYIGEDTDYILYGITRHIAIMAVCLK
nr:MAG TPA: hypothetical protein [Bacteriophage sp.]